MQELTNLAKYPFLKESKDYVKVNNLSVQELLDDPLYERARLIGIERLDNSFKKKDVGNRSPVTESEHIMELLSYPIARMIAVCIEDVYFKRRYALGEAIHAYKSLLNEKTEFFSCCIFFFATLMEFVIRSTSSLPNSLESIESAFSHQAMASLKYPR